MRKGDLVRLNINKCFTRGNGGGRDWPMETPDRDDRGVVLGHRPTTCDERDAWYASYDSKGMTSGGDTKLPPTSTSIELHRGQVYIVERARCAPEMWWRKNPGMTKVRCTVTGETAYVKRDLLEVVSER
jgi:hypothetical protein